MKKLLSIVCCAMVLLAVSSCTKQYITPNPNVTLNSNVASSDWTVFTDDAGNKSYQAPINIKEIKDNFNQLGGIIVSISYDNGTTYEQLPEVYSNLSFSYTYANGGLTLFAQTAGGGLPAAPPDPILVKIVLVQSN